MPNRFGTTSDMIIQTVTENDSTYLLGIDERGLYLTTGNWLDRQLADPNRYASARQNVTARLQALGLDPVMLVEQNSHLVKKESGDKKKVNPLKASKRGMKA